VTDDEAEILEEPADLVLNIPLDLDEQSSADEEGFDRVAVEIFDASFEPLGAWGLSTGKTTHRRRVIKICASSPSPSGDSI
jgi:hypothetical protein